jgi:SPP1 family predicted phage head-tail adaptor
MTYIVNPSWQISFTVTIQQRQFTQDSYGSTTEDWTTIYTTRAAILPLSGSEIFKADEINAQITHRIQLGICLACNT